MCGLDITVGSGTGVGALLAPSWNLVRRWKSHQITPAQYTREYYALLRQRDLSPLTEWLKQQQCVTLCCYCQSGVFCHRHLAVKVVKILLERDGWEVIDSGEI